MANGQERPGAPIRTDSVDEWPVKNRAAREAASAEQGDSQRDRVAGDPPIRRVGVDYGDST